MRNEIAKALAKSFLGMFVEMRLAAEEDYFEAKERLPNRLNGVAIQIARQPYARDFGANFAGDRPNIQLYRSIDFIAYRHPLILIECIELM